MPNLTGIARNHVIPTRLGAAMYFPAPPTAPAPAVRATDVVHAVMESLSLPDLLDISSQDIKRAERLVASRFLSAASVCWHHHQ